MKETAGRGEHEIAGARPPPPWDYYYLRYFVGAVVGAGLLLGLWEDKSTAVLSSFSSALTRSGHEWLDLAAAVAALGTAGLAYCYIASAPILLLHALRFRLARTQKWWPRTFRICFLGTIGIVVAVGVYSAHANVTPSSLRSSDLGLLIYIPYAVIVALQLVGLLLGDLGKVRAFYHELVTRRAGEGKDVKVEEYVESYRHLREHGNAFLIILMELVLAMALYSADNTIILFCLVVVWILPASFTWFLGTWLEFEFPAAGVRPAAERGIETMPFRFGVLLFGGKTHKQPDGRRSE